MKAKKSRKVKKPSATELRIRSLEDRVSSLTSVFNDFARHFNSHTHNVAGWVPITLPPVR